MENSEQDNQDPQDHPPVPDPPDPLEDQESQTAEQDHAEPSRPQHRHDVPDMANAARKESTPQVEPAASNAQETPPDVAERSADHPTFPGGQQANSMGTIREQEAAAVDQIKQQLERVADPPDPLGRESHGGGEQWSGEQRQFHDLPNSLQEDISKHRDQFNALPQNLQKAIVAGPPKGPSYRGQSLHDLANLDVAHPPKALSRYKAKTLYRLKFYAERGRDYQGQKIPGVKTNRGRLAPEDQQPWARQWQQSARKTVAQAQAQDPEKAQAKREHDAAREGLPDNAVRGNDGKVRNEAQNDAREHFGQRLRQGLDTLRNDAANASREGRKRFQEQAARLREDSKKQYGIDPGDEHWTPRKTGKDASRGTDAATGTHGNKANAPQHGRAQAGQTAHPGSHRPEPPDTGGGSGDIAKRLDRIEKAIQKLPELILQRLRY